MNKQKRILLIGDVPGWAFHQIINFIRKNVNGYSFYYDFTVNNPNENSVVESDFETSSVISVGKTRKSWPFQRIFLLRSIIYRSIRYLHRCGITSYDENGLQRKITSNNNYDLVVYLDYYMDKDGDFSYLSARKTIKGIFTGKFPPKGIKLEKSITKKDFISQYLNNCDALLVGAPSIVEVYKKDFNKTIFFANLAYDESIFVPKSHSKKNSFVIGWTGNPHRSFKGYYSHVLPVVDSLNALGYSVELKSQFNGTLDSLVSFWQSVDLALIASEADAGPSMFMEASLCGIPSVSTQVGLPLYVIEDGVNGLFCERQVEDMVEKVKSLIDNHELYKTISLNIRSNYIRKLGVEAQIENWQSIFKTLLNE